MNSANLAWLHDAVAIPDAVAAAAAEQRQAILVKPPGALGRLESLAIRLAALQRTTKPGIDPVRIVLFAGDHGVTAEQVSAFPQSVTAAMLRCFASGGSAIHVLATQLGAELEVLNLGTVEALEPIPGILDCRIGPGTANFTQTAALSESQLAQALQAGRGSVERARRAGVALYLGGEMGIGNTTAATAIAAALLGIEARELAGPGTGLDPVGVQRKSAVIQRALALHRDHLHDPLEVLRCLGGFEIAALTGAYLACAQEGLPVLVDGFICSVAALLAERLRPGCKDWFLLSHVSAEPGHVRLLAALDVEPPLLELGLRLGEGSGAALAVPLLRLACALHNGMATFQETAVAGQQT